MKHFLQDIFDKTLTVPAHPDYQEVLERLAGRSTGAIEVWLFPVLLVGSLLGIGAVL